MKMLSTIMQCLKPLSVHGSLDISIENIEIDSRKVIENTLFVALAGTQSDGHLYIDKAIELGAIAILCEKLPETLNVTVTYVVVENSTNVLGLVASEFYNHPSQSLTLVGVTGTNGKTTIASVLYQLFTKLGYKSGLISTVKYVVGVEEFESTHTTPDAIRINQLLAEMVAAGCSHCFMEVSSHAIQQKRIVGLDFVGAVFTNLTRDHLDYHGSFENYRDTKKMFFDGLSNAAFAITNADDRNGNFMLQNCKATRKSYSVGAVADFRAKIIESQMNGMLLEINGTQVWVQFSGSFNASNILAIYGVATMLLDDIQEILVALSTLTPVAGRFETVQSLGGITGIVDYAHTPDAVKNVIDTINKIRSGKSKLFTVIGAGGNRDKGKRPIMAKEAVVGSDMVILTSDNPRFEEPNDILNDMYAGVAEEYYGKVLIIADRKQAIRTAISLATTGDVLLVAGKGHETYQDVKGVKHHFDDKEILTASFKELNK